MAEATLSRKNQVVLPKEAREALRVRPGDKLLFVVHDDTVIIRPRPKNYADAILGLAEGRFPADYLKKERQGWDKKR